MMMSQNIIKGHYIIILSIRKNPNLDLQGKTSKLVLNLTEKLKKIIHQKCYEIRLKNLRIQKFPFCAKEGRN